MIAPPFADGFNNRILIIDDNPSIHDDFRKVLGDEGGKALKEIEDDEAALFGEATAARAAVNFELMSAFQGAEGLEMVRAAAQAGRPFALAFVDVRMPPGWDGVETITRLWQEFPDLQVVICTVYSDYSWNDIALALKQSDSLLILKKPFDSVEVLQMAHALTSKWHLGKVARLEKQELDRIVNERTAELRAANARLKEEAVERAAAESALRRSEERFSKAFEASPVPMAIEHLATSAFTDVNASFLRMTGHTREELLSGTAAARSVWSDPSFPEQLHQLVAAELPPREFPVEIRTSEGGLRSALLYAEAMELGGDHHLLLIAQDITEQKRLEEQLRQAQKMEAVGRLAAGIAHDFNNILTVIIGNTTLQLASGALNEVTAKALQHVVLAADRATALTRQLLAYSRQQVMQRLPIDLHAHLAQTAEMMKRVIGEDIVFTVEPSDDLPPVLADPSSVDQVFMNLVFNARDAMPDGGRIIVSTGAVTITTAGIGYRQDAIPGDYVRFSLRDTGHGMSHATLGRIFEPFFTTKEQGRGTGMGLATAYGIVKQHDGWIDVRSEPGVGTTFDIYFPRHEGVIENSEAKAQPTVPDHPVCRGTVLVVEDEEMLREFVIGVLGSFGYQVLSAANGAEAIEIWEREKHQIDLLLTDVVMPESISGRQLARRFLEEKETLNVIYTSGYSPELIDSEFAMDSRENFLAKPYHSDRLAKIVSTCFAPKAQLAGGQESVRQCA